MLELDTLWKSITQHEQLKLMEVLVERVEYDVGGITIAQRPDTAKQPDMPESAIASGCIDFVLAPEEIAMEILRITNSTP